MQLSSYDHYRRDRRGATPLDAETERDLARRWAAGDREAGSALVLACLPFVISIAREYRRWGVPLEDLVQQGNLGLLRAASRFEPERACRLVTYAATWIRGEIREYVTRTHRIVRVGSTHTERVALRRFRDGSATSPEELARASGMPLARSRQLWSLLAARDTSLDAASEHGTSVLERLAGDVPTAEDALVARERQTTIARELERALATLGPRERRIVEARMVADVPLTLEALGVELGVSRERVRQLEQRARETLRSTLGSTLGPILGASTGTVLGEHRAAA